MGIDEEPISILVLLVLNRNRNGAWPSGKATGFGPAIRRFESFRPSYSISIYQKKKDPFLFII